MLSNMISSHVRISYRSYQFVTTRYTTDFYITIGTQGVQELFFLWSVGDRSIHGAVYSNDLVNLTRVFGCDVQQERNWEFTLYMQCYIGHGTIAK